MSYLPKDRAALMARADAGVSEAEREAAQKRLDDMNARRWAVRGLHEASHVDPIAAKLREVDAAVERITAQKTIDEMRSEYVELRRKGGLLFELIVRGRVPKGAPPARWLYEARRLAREGERR